LPGAIFKTDPFKNKDLFFRYIDDS
jgi:hypothetical protein